MSRIRLYDVGEIQVDLDKNLNKQVFSSQGAPQMLKIYKEVGSKAMRSVALPIANPKGAGSAANQANVEIAVVNNIIKVKADLSKMIAYQSDNELQGTGKWVGILIDTGLDDITKVKYNNTLLTEDDKKEAALVGGGPGMFVLWIKAEEVLETPKFINISSDGLFNIEMKVVVEEVR